MFSSGGQHVKNAEALAFVARPSGPGTREGIVVANTFDKDYPTQTKLARNVEIRNLAEEAVSLMSQYGSESVKGADEVERFWSLVQETIEEIRGTPTRVETGGSNGAMTSDEAIKWSGRTKLDFGKHNGLQVDQVPIGYLVWLDENNEFAHRLTAYLQSPVGQRRQEEGS